MHNITVDIEPEVNLWIPLTDEKGNMLLPLDQAAEPEPGSILMTEGPYFGTAWQRFFKDGLWYRAGGTSPLRWCDLIRKRNVVLVYDAAPREERAR